MLLYRFIDGYESFSNGVMDGNYLNLRDDNAEEGREAMLNIFDVELQ